MMSPATHFLILALVTLSISPARADIDWAGAPGLSNSDKADIVELVQNVGMDHPDMPSQLTILQHDKNSFVVSSGITVDGLRRTWREIHLCRAGGPGCSTRSRERVGDRIIARESKTQERWRFSDGDWFVDVELGSAISYAQAETIILAIHRKTMILTPEAGNSTSSFDASDIAFVKTVDPLASKFLVHIRSGNTGYQLPIRLQGSEVHLHEVSTITY